MSKTLLVVTGPTASGKTALAIRLAKYFGTEIVSADSRQVYKEMRIGTARPAEEEWEGVKHHLLGHRSVHDNYNAGEFEADALNTIEALFKEKDLVILCGGTGLYIHAVLQGFDDVPVKNDRIRKDVTESYKKGGLIWLQETLQSIDPEYYAQAEIQNPQRLIRAIEIVKITGKSNLTFRKGRHKTRPWRTLKLCIELPRETLYQRIDQRVDRMMLDGLEDEAKKLYPYRTLNALQTVGYTELFDYFDGKINKERAVELIKQHSRNYAKRQITWFRRDTEMIPLSPDAKAEEIAKLIQSARP